MRLLGPISICVRVAGVAAADEPRPGRWDAASARHAHGDRVPLPPSSPGRTGGFASERGVSYEASAHHPFAGGPYGYGPCADAEPVVWVRGHRPGRRR